MSLTKEVQSITGREEEKFFRPRVSEETDGEEKRLGDPRKSVLDRQESLGLDSEVEAPVVSKSHVTASVSGGPSRTTVRRSDLAS